MMTYVLIVLLVLAVALLLAYWDLKRDIKINTQANNTYDPEKLAQDLGNHLYKNMAKGSGDGIKYREGPEGWEIDNRPNRKKNKK